MTPGIGTEASGAVPSFNEVTYNFSRTIPAQNGRPGQELDKSLNKSIRMIFKTKMNAIDSKLKIVNNLGKQFGCG